MAVDSGVSRRDVEHRIDIREVETVMADGSQRAPDGV
jgi:hypothetical protein